MNIFSNFPFPPSQPSSSIIDSNHFITSENGQQHVEISTNRQTTNSMMTPVITDITISNGDCLEQKIPPPPPPPPPPSSSSSSLSLSSVSKSVPSSSLPSATTITATTTTTPPTATTSTNIQQKLLTQRRNDTKMNDERHRKNSLQTTSQNNWPGESDWMENEKQISNKESTIKNGHVEENSIEGEPIWVMRDSYLKRVQREENQSNEQAVEMNKNSERFEPAPDEVINETESLLSKDEQGGDDGIKTKKGSKKEVIVHEPAVLIEGVLFRARYLGSTQLICEGRPTKASRMMQAQEAVARVKAPAGEIQPSTDIDLFISTEKIMVLNTDLQRISDTDVRQVLI
ncbi:hypothetical protein LOAG_07087 [Loa loa]|uniref:PID domain-containing protein n=1 Tax=Loa loa TaxID=7209 RepID=A0A1S0TWC9_LOALO|nr:hypothetical protein LOAG_07087 [Loa loa]EFO21403.1 hypothetical protein LOAG_07087 [Loa loa]